MVSGNPDLSALFQTNPVAALERIRETVQRTGGIKPAAAELGVSRETLHRWLKKEVENG